MEKQRNHLGHKLSLHYVLPVVSNRYECVCVWVKKEVHHKSFTNLNFRYSSNDFIRTAACKRASEKVRAQMAAMVSLRYNMVDQLYCSDESTQSICFVCCIMEWSRWSAKISHEENAANEHSNMNLPPCACPEDATQMIAHWTKGLIKKI